MTRKSDYIVVREKPVNKEQNIVVKPHDRENRKRAGEFYYGR